MIFCGFDEGVAGRLVQSQDEEGEIRQRREDRAQAGTADNDDPRPASGLSPAIFVKRAASFRFASDRGQVFEGHAASHAEHK